MRAEEKKLLLDVQEAGASIEQRCARQTFDQYVTDRWFRRAVEREFEIIGEALNRLERFAPETAARITSLRRIVDFRNRIIHGYDSVDDVIVWRTVEHHLPLLLAEVDTLLGSQPDGSGSGSTG
ncbi:MAG: DUF86 domain-containing protein [Verrucomicrobiota bacterium]